MRSKGLAMGLLAHAARGGFVHGGRRLIVAQARPERKAATMDEVEAQQSVGALQLEQESACVAQELFRSREEDRWGDMQAVKAGALSLSAFRAKHRASSDPLADRLDAARVLQIRPVATPRFLA